MPYAFAATTCGVTFDIPATTGRIACMCPLVGDTYSGHEP